MVEQTLPRAEEPNDQGSCWTCVRRSVECDAGLPHCRTCARDGQVCAGYGIRLRWKLATEIAQDSSFSPPSTSIVPISPIEYQSRTPATAGNALIPSAMLKLPSIPSSLSPFGLKTPENRFLQHYIRYIANIALSVDYGDNGYRSLVPMAMEEPALLNVMLALAASHMSKWRNVQDTESKKYLRQALLHLQKTIKDPILAQKESTLGVILCLVSYEVFNGSHRWKHHFEGIAGWIKSRRDCSDLSPFIKTWICMIDTQSAMNIGHFRVEEIEDWLDTAADREDNQPIIDPLIGCSVYLPKLMLEGARLYNLSRSPSAHEPSVRAEIESWAQQLQSKIRATALDIDSKPLLSVSCDRRSHNTLPTNEFNQPDYLRRITATAEIFRHAMHVYIFRVAYGARTSPPSEIQESINAVFDLLPFVPDAMGPGSNLGWALVVIGSETDEPELRQYISCRWRGLNLLEMNNSRSGERLVKEIWRRRDLAGRGIGVYENWQDVMNSVGGEQILV